MADKFTLTADEQAQLQAMNPELNAARETIEKLKRIGIDVSEQEARVEQAAQIRAGFLREFGSPLRPR